MRIVVLNHPTLDGVMQGPGANEDTRDGFRHGGWTAPGNDDVMARFIAEQFSRPEHVLHHGRRHRHLSPGLERLTG